MRGNFDFVHNATVMAIADRTARQVSNEYKDAEYDDMKQEAFVLLSTSPALRGVLEDEEYGLLQYRLHQDLVEVFSKELRRNHKNISYDMLTEALDGGGPVAAPQVIIEVISQDYERAMVERLLPMLWDRDFAWGIPQDGTIPDPDMPRGVSSKAEGNNLPSYVADIRFAWKHTPLTLKEKQATFLAFGLGLTHEEVSEWVGVTRRVISYRIDTAVGKITAFLNGGYYYDPAPA